jgi:hypothetical protein
MGWLGPFTRQGHCAFRRVVNMAVKVEAYDNFGRPITNPAGFVSPHRAGAAQPLQGAVLPVRVNELPSLAPRPGRLWRLGSFVIGSSPVNAGFDQGPVRCY